MFTNYKFLALGLSGATIIALYPAESIAQWSDTISNCGMLIVAVKNSNLCLDVSDVNDRTQAKLQPCNPSDAGQLWQVRIADDGGIFLESVAGNERVLEVADGSSDRAKAVQIWGLNVPSARGHQQWNIVPDRIRRNVYRIINESTKKCVDIQWGQARENTPIWQWECWDSDAQQWSFDDIIPSCQGPQLPR